MFYPVAETANINQFALCSQSIICSKILIWELMRFTNNTFELIPGGNRLKSYKVLSLVALDSQHLLALTAQKRIIDPKKRTASDVFGGAPFRN